MSAELARYLDCPCCGNDGAEADDKGFFYDGQPLICGCKGSVVCDPETEAYVDAQECER